MKKSLFTLLLLIPLTACQSTPSLSRPTSLKADVSGHFTDVQLNYLTNDDETNTSPYNGNLSVSKPLPVTLSWECEEEATYFVKLYKDEALKEEIVTYSTSEKHFEFYNPMFNQEYYATVSIVDNDGRYYTSDTVSFKEVPTCPGPRNLYVDGVENFRDIGGWGEFVNGEYKTYIKQGMLYRSGRFNEDKADPVNVTISENGLYEVKNHLKIKTEIDLRRTSTNEVGGLTNKSVLGDDVQYIQLPMAYGGNNILTFKGKLNGDDYEYDNPAMIKRFFEILADKDNYPINFHCSIGKDRTGCMAFLIETLIGGDCAYRDYMFTNFADAGMCKISDITDRYGKTIVEYNTFTENKTFAYLNEVIGVSEENLNKIITLLEQ